MSVSAWQSQGKNFLAPHSVDQMEITDDAKTVIISILVIGNAVFNALTREFFHLPCNQLYRLNVY